MSNIKYDYVALKAEYVQAVPRISIRELAARHGMPWSALNAQKNKHDWDDDREKFQKALAVKEIESVTDSIVKKRAVIVADALDVIHAAVFKMAADMQDHWVTDPEHPSTRVFVPGIVVTPDGMT